MKHLGIRFGVLASLLVATPLIAQTVDRPYVEGQVLVRFNPALSAAERSAVRGGLLPTTSLDIPLVPGLELVSTRLDVEQAVGVLANNPNVEFVEPDYIVQAEATPNDGYFGIEWGLNNTGQDIRGVAGVYDADIDMSEAWDLVGASGPAVVAVIDTGTQLDHYDLAANIWTNPGEIAGNGVDDDGNGYIDDVHGWDFFDGDNDPSDDNGHGTHTAGTIAAVTNNGIGVAGICGVCKIMALRFIGPAGGSTSAAIQALQYAVANGARVSNNSWGGGPYSAALRDAIDAAGTAGHIFVTSAGNDAVNTDAAPHYPSSYSAWNLISVAATTNQDLLASFSNYGATSVDIGAPGLNVASTYMNNQYYWMSGTSMASPHVAGVVALLQVNQPELSAQDVVARILSTARPVPALSGITVTGGMLNAQDALADAPPPVVEVPPAYPPAQFYAEDGGNGDAMLTWSTVDDAAWYIIERQERKTKGKNAGDWTGATSFTATGNLYDDSTGAKELRYRIAAANGAGTSPSMSSWQEVTVTDSGSSGGTSGGSPHCHPKKGC